MSHCGFQECSLGRNDLTRPSTSVSASLVFRQII